MDTIALHDCISLLRSVFADASICKVNSNYSFVHMVLIWVQKCEYV